MAIGPINYAMIQRTGDVEHIRHMEDARPLANQQNIQNQVDQREDTLRHQVTDSKGSDRTHNDADAKDEGKGNYSSQGNVRKKEKKKPDAGRVVRKESRGFDIKI
ncbi:MAG: hypothetical protein MR508_10935 [Lachnospiraceae bacterium]|nr:hypothetical protein [Lachnospiraceae bacterium]